MGCLSSRCSEDRKHSPTSTKVKFEETSSESTEAHAHMIIYVKDAGQTDSKDCAQGLDPVHVPETEKEKEAAEIEARLTSSINTDNSEDLITQRTRPSAKSVTLSMAESKDSRYWVQDLKG